MTIIKIKNSNVSGRLPSSGDIEISELALNLADKKLYSKDASGAIFEIGVAGDLPSGLNPPSSGNNIGDLFYDTTEGNLVYWDGSAWIPIVGDEDGEGYVKVSGSNMTGNLTLGTDKITLNAGTGVAAFDGTVVSGDPDESEGAAQGAKFGSTGTITTKKATGSTGEYLRGYTGTTKIFNVGATGTLNLGTDISSAGTTNISLDGTAGSATFGAGDIVIGNGTNTKAFTVLNTVTAAKAQIGIYGATNDAQARGRITLDGVDSLVGSNLDAVVINRENSPDQIKLKYDGSASFAGDIGIGGTLPSTPNISLNADGSAAFASSIEAGGSWSNDGSPQVRAFIGSNVGSVRVKGASSADGNTNAFGIYKGGNDAAAQVMSVQYDGSAEFAGTVTATVVPPSDARFKENITPAKPQLADVVALGGLLKNYDWNDQAPLNEELRSQRQLGLIAQEAETVCPAIVKDIKRTKTVEVEAAVTGPKGAVIKEAVTKEEDDSYKGISQEALIMKLIGAVAELSAEVTALKAVKTTKK